MTALNPMIMKRLETGIRLIVFAAGEAALGMSGKPQSVFYAIYPDNLVGLIPISEVEFVEFATMPRETAIVEYA